MTDKENNSSVFYTSRSAIECYQRCPRKRYLNYHYQGTGIVPTGVSVPLTTGTCVHQGVQILLTRYRAGNFINGSITYEHLELTIEEAVKIALKSYNELVKSHGFTTQSLKSDAQQLYTYMEQRALTEALIRAYALEELPVLLARFDIVGAEREIVVPLTDGIMMQIRADAELVDKKDKGYYIYSLKTVKDFGEREQSAYANDLQGLTEIWGCETDANTTNERIKSIGDAIRSLSSVLGCGNDFYEVHQYIESKKCPNVSAMGVRFCFLVKGYWAPIEKGNKESQYVTRNPLIRGFKSISPTEINYAYSDWYPNPDNKSGWGKLGKGWEKFDVWSDNSWKVKEWVEAIKRGEIKGNCQNVIRDEVVVTPQEYFRKGEDIEETIGEIIKQERYIKHSLDYISFNPDKIARVLIDTFPRYRQSCNYPTRCEYHSVCWGHPTLGDSVKEDPIGSGLYQIRVPHHPAEKEQVRRKVEGNKVNQPSST